MGGRGRPPARLLGAVGGDGRRRPSARPSERRHVCRRQPGTEKIADGPDSDRTAPERPAGRRGHGRHRTAGDAAHADTAIIYSDERGLTLRIALRLPTKWTQQDAITCTLVVPVAASEDTPYNGRFRFGRGGLLRFKNTSHAASLASCLVTRCHSNCANAVVHQSATHVRLFTQLTRPRHSSSTTATYHTHNHATPPRQHITVTGGPTTPTRSYHRQQSHQGQQPTHIDTRSESAFCPRHTAARSAARRLPWEPSWR